MNTILQLLRVKSWVKNGFLFLPLIFSLQLTNTTSLLWAVHAVIIFSFVSSSIYIINDLLDAKADAEHPRKKLRPVASGKIKKSTAFLAAFVCVILAIGLSFISKMPTGFLWVLFLYFILNIAYSWFLKRVSIIELMVVATNFVLRVLAGCFAISVAPSHWILVVTFFLSLLMVVVKRKSEIILLDSKAVSHRKVLDNYSLGFLNMLIYMSATITITAYLLYSIDVKIVSALKTNHLMYSTLFVVLGIIRFIQISESKEYEGEGDPTIILFKDRFIQITVLSWLMYLYIAIYVFHS